MVKYSYGFVVLPGGIGTLDELLEVLTLIRTGKTPEVPVVLLGTKFWSSFVSMIDEIIREGLAEESDRELFLVTDSVEEMLQYIQKKTSNGRGKLRILKYKSPQN